MENTPPAAHAAHDELLIARLFGGDVSDVERERALDVMGECSECADLFADLGAIADATESVPVPVRPRDFSLTAADAARLSRRRWSLGALVRPGLRQSLGGALAALGLAGFMLTGVVTLFGGTGGANFSALSPQDRFADQNAGAAAASAGPEVPGAAPTLAPLVAATNASAYTTTGSGQGPEATPAALATAPGVVMPGATPPPDTKQGSAHASASGSTELAAGGTGDRPVETSAASSSGIDARIVWLGGFGLLFLVGLAVILGPWLIGRRGRRGRGARS
jgi:hypothetical protein